MTFYNVCFDEIKKKTEENGGRSIDFDEVDRLVVEVKEPRSVVYSRSNI